MRYFYLDAGRRVGPYTPDELRQLHLNGVVKPDTQILADGSDVAIPFSEYWAKTVGSGVPPKQPSGARTWKDIEDLTQRTREDLRALIPHLLIPLDEIRSLRWIENRRLIAIAVIGLLPLFLLVGFAQSGEMRAAYWGLALYVSVLWAIFFYYVFPAPQITLVKSALCFFVTGAISVSILLLLYRIPPLSWLGSLHSSENVLLRLLGFLAGVGVPEELCKAVVLFILLRRGALLPPQALLFYGLMSGLGFGIYEGVGYQTGKNLTLRSGPEYYLANVLRLTSLPFLHAIWTGIAGYFIAFAHQYPARKYGLLVIAIGVPAALHGFYNFFSNNVVGLMFALFSVLALFMYLAKSVYFEQVLAGTAPPTESTPAPKGE